MLGRRRDLSTISTIYDAVCSSDELMIVNLVDALIQFGVPLNCQFKLSLLKIIQDGLDVRKRMQFSASVVWECMIVRV